MRGDVVNFAAHKAKAEQAKAAGDRATIAITPAQISRLRTQVTVFDLFDKHLGTGRPPSLIQADIVEMGRRLSEFRRVGGGNWATWLKQQDWSEESAQSYISIYEWHSRCINEALISGSDTPWNFELEDPLDLHVLVHESTPEAAREEVIRRTGRLTSATVTAIVRKARANARQRKSRWSS